MRKQRVYLWGFPEEDGRHWPPDLEPIHTEGWPAEAPVVVHASAAEQFQREAMDHLSPDGRLPEAILYLPRGAEAPEGAWAYFDATVQEGDWNSLLALLVCPRQFKMAEMAEELPVAFLAGLDQPVEELTPQKIPLPEEEDRRHLVECPTCREAFGRSLQARLRLRRQLLCPGTNQLAAYVRGIPDAQVEGHLGSCQVCQAQVTVLQQELAPTPVWLQVPLEPIGAQVWVDVVDEEVRRRALGVLAVLLIGCARNQLIPQIARRGRIRGAFGADELESLLSGTLEADRLKPLLEQASEGNPLLLLRPRRDLTLAWDASQQAFWIGNLHGEGKARVEEFRIEVRREDKVLWEGDSQQEKVWIPLKELERVLQSGADQMVIRIKKKRK